MLICLFDFLHEFHFLRELSGGNSFKSFFDIFGLEAVENVVDGGGGGGGRR